MGAPIVGDDQSQPRILEAIRKTRIIESYECHWALFSWKCNHLKTNCKITAFLCHSKERAIWIILKSSCSFLAAAALLILHLVPPV
jgi:hypothetical protein